MKIKSVTATPDGSYEFDEDTGLIITAKFTNTYTVTPTTYQPKAKKVMGEGSNTLAKDITFDFRLTLLNQVTEDETPVAITTGCYKSRDLNNALQNNAVVSEKQITVPQGTNPGDTITPVSFDEITFKEAGLYTFKA